MAQCSFFNIDYFSKMGATYKARTPISDGGPTDVRLQALDAHIERLGVNALKL